MSCIELYYLIGRLNKDINNKKAFKAQGKCVIADVICYWKMMSFMALDRVMSYLRLINVTNTCKRMRCGLSIGGRS